MDMKIGGGIILAVLAAGAAYMFGKSRCHSGGHHKHHGMHHMGHPMMGHPGSGHYMGMHHEMDF